MNIEICLEELTLENLEYAYLTETVPYSSGTFRVYIPKVMPGISYGTNKQWLEAVNPGLFVNSDKCKITSSKTVTCQNYLTVPRYTTSDFSHRADRSNRIHPSAKFVADVMNGNIKDMRLREVL